MPMYADLLEANKDAPLDFVLPYDQADKDGPTETQLLADELYGDGEKAPSSQRRVYLLEDHAPVLQERLGKRKRHLDTVEETDEHVDSDDDKRRPDALLLHGEPISKLGTDRIFEYVATYCDVPPTSLEWIDDRTTVIIFDSPDVAQSSLVALSKNAEPDSESLVAAHPVPKKMWPPEAQLDHNLSRGTALSGVMRVRWARYGDRKLKGARRRSEWYQEHQGRSKRSRGADEDLDAELDEMQRRREAGDDAAALDDELDAIRRGEDDSSRLRNRLGPKKDRQIAPLPKRRGRGERSERSDRGERNERPKRTQDDLDAELDAFMKSRE